MWARPLFTAGEWAVYTALWSYPNDSVIPTYQDLCDRAWVERSTAIAAVTKAHNLGLLEKEASEREADGGQSSNTYYLIEVPTPKLIALIAQLTAERQKLQESKRKKRKESNRKYEKPRASGQGGGTILADPLYASQGGSMQMDPPGVDADGPPGGSVRMDPRGVHADSTHETLGVTEVLSLPLGTTSSATEPQQEKTPDPSTIEYQEDETAESVMKPRVLPTLTEWEEALIAECLPLAGRRWDRLSVRKVLGSQRIREITACDPELVRRAFLIGAANRDGVTVPKRMWHTDWCPHWREAERQLDAERNPRPASRSVSAASAIPQPRVLAKPSSLQEDPVVPGGPALDTGEAARAYARAVAKRTPAEPAAPRFLDRMAAIDQVLASGGKCVMDGTPDPARENLRARR